MAKGIDRNGLLSQSTNDVSSVLVEHILRLRESFYSRNSNRIVKMQRLEQ